MKTYRYYSILRPVSIGTTPASAIIHDFENFPTRRYAPEVGRDAWGYVELANPLTVKECNDYDLIYWEPFLWMNKPLDRTCERARWNLLSEMRRHDNMYTFEIDQTRTEKEMNQDATVLTGILDEAYKNRLITLDDYQQLLDAAFIDYVWDEINPEKRKKEGDKE